MLIKRRAHSIAQFDLDRPLFIVGAPCAGTSPLFELLARAKGVETFDQKHRIELRTLLESGKATPERLRALAKAGLPGGRVRWLSGVVANARNIPLLNEAFPGALFIYVHRDAKEQLARMMSDEIGSPPEAVATEWAATTGKILVDLSTLPARRWCSVDIDGLLADRVGEAKLLGRFAGVAWRVQPGAAHRAGRRPHADAFAKQAAAVFPSIATRARDASAFQRANHASQRDLPEENLWQSIKALPEQAAKALVAGRLTAGLLAGTALVPAVASAATDTVTSSADDLSSGTLREQIANASAGDTIVFAPGLNNDTIVLVNGVISIEIPLTIQGPGSALLTIDGGGEAVDGGGLTGGSRIFYLYAQNPATDAGPATPADIVISGLTLQHANFNENGAAIAVNNTNVTLEDVTLQDNVTSRNGAGLYYSAQAGSLILQNSLVTGNTAARGGGVFLYSDSSVLIDHATFSGNTTTEGNGGGVYLQHKDKNALATISNSTISGNTTHKGNGAGVIINYSSVNVDILNTTVSGNTAIATTPGSGKGGGIFFYGSGSIINSTITDNSSIESNGDGGFVPAGSGGGAYLYDSAITIANTTIAGNSSAHGGGIFNYGAANILTDSIVAGNTPDDLANAGGSSFDTSFSLIQNPGTAVFMDGPDGGLSDGGIPDGGEIPGTGNIGWEDPLLGALANNGGPTETMLPETGSPVINTGDPDFAADLLQDLPADYSLDAGIPDGSVPLVDQRGLDRVVSGRIDMGAVEVQLPDAGSPDAGSVSTDAGSVSSPDAGSAPSKSKSGCNCNSTSDAALALLTPIGALLLRRRRRTNRAA